MTTRAGRRYRRARRLRSNRRGLVAVIGTLLALLVFFALFGIFLTQYVPLWMTDNESAFTNGVAASFAQLKADIDTQYVLGVPPTMGVPFTLSSQGIPLIAQPTEGVLSFLPQTCPQGFHVKGQGGANSTNYGQPVDAAYCVFENQTLQVGPGGSGQFSLSVPTGILSMTLPNRYFTPEEFTLEDDGVVQVQSGMQSIMAFAPPFNITRLAGNTTVTSSFLQLYGNATTVVAQGTQEVYSHLRFNQHLTSNGNTTSKTFAYTFEVGTQNPCAWSKFLWNQLNVSGVPSSQYSFTPYSASCLNPSGATSVLTIKLLSVNYASVFYAGVQLNAGIGSS